MDVEWRNLSVTIGEKQILRPCSGSLNCGRMLAVMGPSGSGKTTFLSCLRQDVPHVGSVQFNRERFHRGLRQLIGFVEQEDVVLPQLTVRQSLLFLAELRFGIGSAKAATRVDEVVAAVRLGRVVDSIVGEQGSKQRISGGERKRLCIARELLGDPQLLMCDEPTSGLDSTMAEQVVRAVRALSDSGKISMMASIHQPSASIFAQFDDLLLLSEGNVMYFGPTKEAEEFFTMRGPPRHPLQSTAEYLMDLLVLDAAEADVEDQADRGLGSGLSKDARAGIIDHWRLQFAMFAPLPAPKGESCAQRYAAPMARQMFLLARRHYFLLVSEVFTWLNLLQQIGLVAIPSLLWLRLGFTEADVFPRWGACMWTMGTWMFFPLMAGIATFPSVKKILEKELRVGCYSLTSFYVARTLLLLPLDLVFPTMWTTGVFWLTNLRPDFGVFLQVLLLVYASFTAYQGIGLAISASGMPPARSGVTCILLITYFFAWSGFFMSFDRVPSFIAWASEVNPFRFSVELMMQMLMQGEVAFECGQITSGGDQTKNSMGCTEAADGTLVLTGRAALERHGMTTNPLVCVAIISMVLVGARVMAFGLLWWDLRTAIVGAKEVAQDEVSHAGQSAAVAVSAAAPVSAREMHSVLPCRAVPELSEKGADMTRKGFACCRLLADQLLGKAAGPSNV